MRCECKVISFSHWRGSQVRIETDEIKVQEEVVKTGVSKEDFLLWLGEEPHC